MCDYVLFCALVELKYTFYRLLHSSKYLLDRTANILLHVVGWLVETDFTGSHSRTVKFLYPLHVKRNIGSSGLARFWNNPK